MRGLRIASGVVGALLLLWGALILVVGGSQGTLDGFNVAFAVFVLVLGAALVGLALRGDRGRPCPQCGKGVKRGLVECPTCGYDFRLPQRASA